MILATTKVEDFDRFVDGSARAGSISRSTTIKRDTMHKNAELVRRGYEAFNKADLNALSDILDEKVSWHTPGRSSTAGDYVGRDAVFGQFGRYGGGTDGTFRAELRHLLADDEGHVVGIHHNTGERRGKRLDVDY